MRCSICGTEYESGFCPKGCQVPGFAEKKKKKSNGKWIWPVSALFFGFLLGFLVGAGNVDKRVPPKAETSLESTYKYSCQFMELEALVEHPEWYISNDYVCSGTVLEVMEPKDRWNNTLSLRVRVIEGEEEATIFATVELPEKEKTIRKGDTIDLWGVCKGPYTYQTDKGKTVTLPKLDAVYYTVR